MNQKIISEIARVKSLMQINEATMKLGDETFASLKVDDDIKNNVVNSDLLSDIDKAAQNAGVVVTITTAKTDHPSYETGKESRHASNNAVDIAIINGIGSDGATNEKNGNPKFRELGNKFANQLERLGYSRNSESGKSKAFIWQTNLGGNHFNHIHVSNSGGGTVSEPEKTKTSDDLSSYDKIYQQVKGALKDVIGKTLAQ